MHKNTLAVDPGLTAIGIVVIGRGGDLKHYEVITTPRTHRTSRRLRAIDRRFTELLDLFGPGSVVLEATWPTRHPVLGTVHRVARLCRRRAQARGIPVDAIPAATARKSVTGSGRTSKTDAARILCRSYPELRIYLRQTRAWKERHFLNVFDALAVALHHQAGRRA